MSSSKRLGKRSARYSALGLVAALALTACGGGSGSNASANNTLVIGIESEPDILDPQGGGGWVTYRISHQMFDGLVAEDLSKPSSEAAVTDLAPGLATSWDISPDGLTYTFHLRQ